jgi:peptidyl-prolyl cis-trans isomerase C
VKKTITTIVALALAATAIAQDKPKQATPAAPAATAAASTDPIIIAAGNVAIRQSEFESAMKTLPTEYQQYIASPAGKRQFAEEYLRMKMLAAEGLKGGLDKDPEVVRQLDLMKENLVANAQIQKMEKGIALSDDELKKKYDAEKATYEQVTARHILIAFKGSPAAQQGKPELTEEQAKAKAEELRKKIASGAAKFEDVAKAESDDLGSGANGGDLGAFGRGQMVPEFEKATFEGKVGEVSEPIRTQYGYHIIRVEKREHTPFEQVRPVLERNEKQAKLTALLESLKTNAKPTFDAKYFPPEAPKTDPPAAVVPATEKKP